MELEILVRAQSRKPINMDMKLSEIKKQAEMSKHIKAIRMYTTHNIADLWLECPSDEVLAAIEYFVKRDGNSLKDIDDEYSMTNVRFWLLRYGYK